MYSLLNLGGKKVVVRFDEAPEFCKVLSEFGRITARGKLEMHGGGDSECHSNSVLLRSQNKDKYILILGYALSDDNLWRRHSWAITKDGILIETTIQREEYFGLVMDNELAESFFKTYK